MTQPTHYLLQFFEVHDRLREDLKPTSALFHNCAQGLHDLPRETLQTHGADLLRVLVDFYHERASDNPEAQVAAMKVLSAKNLLVNVREDVSRMDVLNSVLRLMLEAKDCAVRAVLYKEPT